MLDKIVLHDLKNDNITSKFRQYSRGYFFAFLMPTMLNAFFLFLYFTAKNKHLAEGFSFKNLNIMTGINAMVFIGCLILFIIQSNSIFKEKKYTILYERAVSTGLPTMLPIEKNSSQAFKYFIVCSTLKQYYLFMFLFVTLYGSIVLIKAMTSKVLFQYPLYWLNGISYLYFAIFCVFSFPTEKRVINFFNTKLRYLIK